MHALYIYKITVQKQKKACQTFAESGNEVVIIQENAHLFSESS